LGGKGQQMVKVIIVSLSAVIILVVLFIGGTNAKEKVTMLKNIKWSENPGCFERHLQRRYANQLFPADRQNITMEEIETARIKDMADQNRFIATVKNFGSELENMEDENEASTLKDTSCLQKIQALLEEAASIGGNIQNAIRVLESTEESLIQNLNRIKPKSKDLLKRAHSLSVMARVPIIAQLKRKDTPILPSEEIPSILTEDRETIEVVGFISRSFPDFRPSETDIKLHLENAIKDGFSRSEAQRLIDIWNQMN
jgi:hypothetical protein